MKQAKNTKQSKQKLGIDVAQLQKQIDQEKGKPPSIRGLFAMSPEEAEKIYSHAYLLYNTGRYKEASDVFRILTTLSATEFKYMMGLAACYHMQKEYQTAAGTYLVVSSIDPLNPIPYFHASDCYIQIGDKVSAVLMLEMALKRSKNMKEYATLKQRAEITLNGLKQELLPGS